NSSVIFHVCVATVTTRIHSSLEPLTMHTRPARPLTGATSQGSTTWHCGALRRGLPLLPRLRQRSRGFDDSRWYEFSVFRHSGVRVFLIFPGRSAIACERWVPVRSQCLPATHSFKVRSAGSAVKVHPEAGTC